jgi:hypothetical protein
MGLNCELKSKVLLVKLEHELELINTLGDKYSRSEMITTFWKIIEYKKY